MALDYFNCGLGSNAEARAPNMVKMCYLVVGICTRLFQDCREKPNQQGGGEDWQDFDPFVKSYFGALILALGPRS